jgi:hypothetical protein
LDLHGGAMWAVVKRRAAAARRAMTGKNFQF